MSANRTREIALCLRTLATLAEDVDSNTSTHRAEHNHLQFHLNFQRI